MSPKQCYMQLAMLNRTRDLVLQVINMYYELKIRETCQWLKFPLNGLWAHSRVSPVVGLLPLASAPACLGTDYKTNAQITKDLKITPMLDKLLEYKRSWIQHVNRTPRNRLPRVLKYYWPTGRRNRGGTLKRLLDTWDRNGSTSGPTPWQIYDDDDELEINVIKYSDIWANEDNSFRNHIR